MCRSQKHGIRIILDGVFSHTGSDSLYFNREGRYGPGGAYRDRNSPYRSWYDFDSGYVGGYRSWWGFETLPEVEEEDPSYGNFVCGKGGVIDTWLGLGASGFRLDVADELPDDLSKRSAPPSKPTARISCSSAKCGRTPPPRKRSTTVAPTCAAMGWMPP